MTVVQNETKVTYVTSPFQKAVKHEAKLRMAIAGPSGSGKTYTALRFATALGGKIAVIDTEHGSASKYADLFDFDVLELDPPYHPDRYIEAVTAAGKAGYDTVIIDSLSHAWFGAGGLLEIVDDFAKQSKSGNSYVAWKQGTPIQNRLIDSILAAPLHVIATMRAKQDYAIGRDDATGKSTVTKLGLAPIQREGVEYEFDVYADMTVPASDFVITKTRCPELSGKVFNKPGENVIAILKPWLSGAKPAHWIDDPAKRRAFWAKAASLGMDEAAIQKLAGIEHVHDWPGTAAELLALCQRAAGKDA